MSSIKRKSDNVESKSSKKLKKNLSDKKLKEICSLFLSSKKNANLLADLLDQFQKPNGTKETCVTAVENLFLEVLQRKDMTLNDTDSEAERQYKEWLCNCYEDALSNLAKCLQKGTAECKLQALVSLFKLLSQESKFPITKAKKKKNKNNFPTRRLLKILQSICLSGNLSSDLIEKLTEYFEYKDVSCNTWLTLECLAKELLKQQPDDSAVWCMLMIMSKLPKTKKVTQPDVHLCEVHNVVPDDRRVRAAVSSLWQQLSRWTYSPRTHQLLLVVLIERIMPLMDNAIFLTDYFMDALNRDECEINMLALQGIFNLITTYNIEYPDIYGRLYQLHSVDALKAKYKSRLFALTDTFLSSTHLPLGLVAAFAKRFARLLLLSAPPDALIFLTFILNLLIRHPNLSFLCHNPNSKEVTIDPYDDEEKDPMKSGALQSQLWEVKLMQHHHSERVAKLASAINNDLPTVEYPLLPLLDLTWNKMIYKEIKRLSKEIPKVTNKFDKKLITSNMQEAMRIEYKTICDDFQKLFELP